MKCWKCGAAISDSSDSKVSFRATCDQCGAALHCCQNCKYYKPGLPNDCAVPGTDFIPDRQANNFCEEFRLLDKTPSPTFDPSKSKKNFDDLFK